MADTNQLTLVYSAEDIQQRVLEIGKEVTEWVTAKQSETGKQVVAICVLKGALYFYADLLRAINTSCEPLFCIVENFVGDCARCRNVESKFVTIGDWDLAGRAVLIIDDICDTGQTLQLVEQKARDYGAHDVASAVLIQRSFEKWCYQPRWRGFEYSSADWFVGYGLDDCGSNRNLRSIYCRSELK